MKTISRFFIFATLIFCSQFVFAQFIFAQNDSDKIKKNASNSHREIVYEFSKRQDSKNTTRPDWVTGNYFKLTISPQKFSYPILKHRLNVPLSFIEYENAYPFYVEAKKEFDKVKNECLRTCWQSEEYQKVNKRGITKEQRIELDDKKYQMEYDNFPLYMSYYFSNKKIVRVSAEKDAEIYDKLSHVYKLLEKGSRSRYYKWGNRNDLNGIATLTPFAGDAHDLGRYLSSKADWEIRNGKYDDATKTIRVGLALGNHIFNSAPNTYITIYTGNKIHRMMQRQILCIIAQPNAPNLYPELTQLRPIAPILTDAIIAIKTGDMLFKPTRPEIWDNYDNLSESECKEVIEQLPDFILFFGPQGLGGLRADCSYEEYCQIRKNLRSRVISLFCAFSYQLAKERLRKRGLSDEKINSLSIYQVIAPYAMEEISNVYDMLSVSATLPESERNGEKIFIKSISEADKKLIMCSSVDILIGFIFRDLGSSHKQIIEWTDQLYDLIKIIEAIRYYAAVYDGKLPESLDAIKETPVPKICLLSGKPYVYKVEGKTITIDYTAGFDYTDSRGGFDNSKLDSRLELVVE
ncbi:MAG: hypothetical protein LBP59_01580 [Planctomycetaceae bacterium]|jgi:hypothetical protein|nr:hypothetical protein [Planctomycetaceae bacterium]